MPRGTALRFNESGASIQTFAAKFMEWTVGVVKQQKLPLALKRLGKLLAGAEVVTPCQFGKARPFLLRRQAQGYRVGVHYPGAKARGFPLL
jgi:hypothetical protein